ncbi:MAG: CoA pyrophosphatase [Pseudomonadales bacterium]|nr:CoA pyrophosphatase [Pseudomonadales bacterium]
MPVITTFKYNLSLREKIKENLAGFSPVPHPEDADLTAAAVAVTIFDHESEGAVIVTKRSPRLKDHTGQWAMPGGRVDEGETPPQAALRELHEEVNLELGREAILGRLDDYVTRSGYVITPIVVWAGIEETNLHPNPDEVASIHAFSFTELIREDSPRLESIPESDRQVLSMNYLDDRIYAPTAAMLYQFREVAIHGRHTRVSHFDQPVFAWS